MTFWLGFLEIDETYPLGGALGQQRRGGGEVGSWMSRIKQELKRLSMGDI
jgi:hypothetical protein